ncbi:hypothetical protein V1525DRAFT_419233 [Lipomyces kononenkoae]|uniref:Uncharacterized protein n=1 Tax=Lipomyces kononenkoae TaxID=34357 RepID=A0ACC3T1D9_LIPKO
MRLYIPKPVPKCNDNDNEVDHTDRPAAAADKMRATAIDRAISKRSNLMLLSFAGLVIAAFSFVTFFGKLPTLALPADQDEEEEEDVDEEGEGSKPSQKHKAKTNK